ncbi:hypothetical protein [Methylobacterium variabile]|uniref:hypothetical protein n=1 Tax=Methylobacterium variabile TaxID=298794 RepID=UPI0012EE90B2|nr:hypothetical protein [Methylobacterium variabile]
MAGDLLWHLDRDGSVYRNGKYIGRGKWTAVEVQSAGRQSVEVGDKAYPRSYRKYARDTGLERGWSGHGYQDRLFGHAERAEHWWRGQAYKLAELIKDCRNIETLKTIAFTLDAPQPPDFSVTSDAEGSAR